MEGTITWFKVSEQPPSDIALLLQKDTMIAKGVYKKEVEHYFHGSGNWQPTHWAYINYPS